MKRTALPAVLLLAALAACTDDPTRQAASTGTPAPPPAPSSPAVELPSPSPTPSPSPSSGFAGDEQPDTGTASGGRLTVTAVRVGTQRGFQRVVFELHGKTAGAPGWRVEYVDRATADGSGKTVDVDGQAVLQVVLTGIGYPFDTGQTEASQDLHPGGSGVVREVDLQGTYEGQFQAFVGLTDRRAFRVFRLADPARVVVDVADATPAAG